VSQPAGSWPGEFSCELSDADRAAGNAFHCNINGSELLEVASALKSSGMLAAGYKSVNIVRGPRPAVRHARADRRCWQDDCWPLRERDASGNIVADPAKFPNGMGGFSKSLKALGVGLGIYTAHGNLTCQRFPGSFGYETQDAALYKEWGVIFVKNDWCWRKEENQTKHLDAFNAMRDALNGTGVPMVHSIHWNYDDTPGPGCPRGKDCPLPLTSNM
jgi:alpha-galactosidase